MAENGISPPQYQVFINFRGSELRNSLVGFLVKAMRSGKINVFTDEVELRGTGLQNLFRRIEESRVAVAIFSERYTESRWCLDERADGTRQARGDSSFLQARRNRL
uniref:Vesicle-associated protein 1-4 n=1 Tax=Noccaea caerulescens TaxID=107243 RepID=A0A1J3HBB0_NOCCA